MYNVLLGIQATTFMLFMATMFASVGVYLGYIKGFKKILEWRLFGNADKKHINQLEHEDEPVIVEGTVKPTEQHGKMESELTGEECVVYQYKIQEDDLGTGADNTTSIIDTGSDGVPFYIEGEHRKVYVEPQNATISMEKEYENQGDIRPEKIQQSSVFGSIDLSSYHHIEYIEKEIEVGQKGAVLGKATDTRMNAEFKIEKTGDRLMISDTDPSSTQKRLLYKGIISSIIGGVFLLATLITIYLLFTGI